MPAHSPRISVASPTGQQWRIGHGRQEVIVCEVGATLRAYTVGPTTVLDGFGADEWSHSGRGQVLAPWPNRLADGRYEFNGVRAQAALDEPERRNAIHGLVRWMPWTLQTRHQNQLSLRLQLHPSPGYPFSLLLELEYHVGREGLTVTTRAQSLEEGPIPFGIGFHPYLTAGTETVDGAILHVPARHTLDMDERGLPTGARTPVEGTERDFTTARFVGPVVLDTAYTTLERDADGLARASLDAPGGVGGAALWVDCRLSLPHGVHGRHAGRGAAAPARRRHGADDLPAQRVPHRRRRDRAPAGAGVDGPVGDRAAVTRTTVSGAVPPGAGRRRHGLLERHRRRHGARPSPPREPPSSSTRRARSTRARRSPRRCPTRTTSRATSPSRTSPTVWWPPRWSAGAGSTRS